MKSLITFSLLVLLTMGAQAMAQETEYQFGVRWSVNGLASSVDIQNIMLDFKGVPSEQNTMLPATEYIRNGRNAVQLYAWPVPSADPFASHHELRLSLEYWEPGQNPNIEAQTAFEVVLRPGQDNPAPEIMKVDDNAPLRIVADAIQWDADYFKLEVPFTNRQSMPTWCWEEGDVLRDNDATRDSLAREYRRLHALFAAGNNEALLNAAATRTKELALASGTPEEYVRHRFSYDMFFDNPDVYQLNDFPEEPMTLNLGADNRVAWLTTEGVQVPIRFNHVQENDVSSRVRPYFIRRDGQWEICR